ncbi:MAG TPA: sigma-70 family RNA polymerase sigma factor [Planctomycetota bacterium]|nr:sigma-70 family RNA polymerase sigma factor [Planctomycetota bacterium]
MTVARRDPEPLLAHAGWVRALALQLCADVHAAEDAAQDTLAAVLRHPPDDSERSRGFLTRTLHNVLAMSARSKRRRTRREQLAALPADAAVVDASELVARAELHRQLVVAVLALPEAWRELVLRHYFEGEDTTTLARRARVSQDAVRAQLRRARERLRAELERDGGEPARAFSLLVAASRPAVVKPRARRRPGSRLPSLRLPQWERS